MKCLDVFRKTLVVVGFVTAVLLGSVTVKADFTFGGPINLGPPVNSSANDWSLCISTDGLELYFESERPGGYGCSDLWVTKRQSKSDSWGIPVNLGSQINTPTYDWSPNLSVDGLSLYFCSGGHSGYGSNDVFVITRASRSEPWSEPENLGPLINTPANDGASSISSDGLELYYHSDRPGTHGVRDIWVAERTTVSESWGEPMNLGPIINRSTYNVSPSISSDGLRLFYSSGSGNVEFWMTKRVTRNAQWEEPIYLGLGYGGTCPHISHDGLTLYFSDFAAGNRPPGGLGGDDLWQVSIDPIVDFNGDKIVDAEDMCIMVDFWGTNEPLCDIGPMPWGDGIVDVEDLIVLAEHLFEVLPGRRIEP